MVIADPQRVTDGVGNLLDFVFVDADSVHHALPAAGDAGEVVATGFPFPTLVQSTSEGVNHGQEHLQQRNECYGQLSRAGRLPSATSCGSTTTMRSILRHIP